MFRHTAAGESELRHFAASDKLHNVGAFLRRQCGSLKESFSLFDSHNTGSMSADSFAEGLRSIGCTEDPDQIFRVLDREHTGLVTMKAFLIALEPRAEQDELLTNGRLGALVNYNDVPLRSCASVAPSQQCSVPENKIMPTGSDRSLESRMMGVEQEVVAERRYLAEVKANLSCQMDELIVREAKQIEDLQMALAEECAERRVENKVLLASFDALQTAHAYSDRQPPPKLRQDEMSLALREVLDVARNSETVCSLAVEELKVKFEALQSRMESRLATVAGTSAEDSLSSSNVNVIFSRMAALEERVNAASTEWRRDGSDLRNLLDQMSANVLLLQEGLSARFDDVEGERRRINDVFSAKSDALAQVVVGVAERVDSLHELQSIVPELQERVLSLHELQSIVPQLEKTIMDTIDQTKLCVERQHFAVRQPSTSEFERNVFKLVVAETKAEARTIISEEMKAYREEAAKNTMNGSERLLESNASLRAELGALSGRLQGHEPALSSRNAQELRDQLGTVQAQLRACEDAVENVEEVIQMMSGIKVQTKRVMEKVESQGQELDDLRARSQEGFVHHNLLMAADLKVARLSEKVEAQGVKLHELSTLLERRASVNSPIQTRAAVPSSGDGMKRSYCVSPPRPPACIDPRARSASPVNRELSDPHRAGMSSFQPHVTASAHPACEVRVANSPTRSLSPDKDLLTNTPSVPAMAVPVGNSSSHARLLPSASDGRLSPQCPGSPGKHQPRGIISRSGSPAASPASTPLAQQQHRRTVGIPSSGSTSIGGCCSAPVQIRPLPFFKQLR